MWKIRLVLEGGLTHTTNDVRSGSPGWADCRPSAIQRIEFPFVGIEDGKNVKFRLILAGMKEYNFFVEAVRGIVSGKTEIKGLWFLGKVPGTEKVTGFVIRDKILAINSIAGKEYGGFSTVGWKPGIVGEKVTSIIERSM